LGENREALTLTLSQRERELESLSLRERRPHIEGDYMQSRVPQVLECFVGGYNCCQSILATYGDLYGLERETALKLGSGMGGGVGHTGELCGFVSAACLLLGLKYGSDAANAKLKMNPICLEFCDEFKAKYGSVNCIDIIKRDIRTTEATVKAKEDGAFQICGECGQFVAELLEKKYDILNP
jgi:C_GCAxxG_C_C family probable redox protein